MSHKFKATLLQFHDNLWDYHMVIPEDIYSFLLKNGRRTICVLEDSVKIHAALMHDGQGGYFINLNKEVRNKLKLDVGNEFVVEISSDTSEYGIEVPDVFLAMCEEDPEGSKYFHALTIGKQRSLLHIMNKPKSEQKKLEKTFVIFDYLKLSRGNLDFKELNEAFKNSRFKEY